MKKYLFIVLLVGVCLGENAKINSMYCNGYFFDESPSILKINLDSSNTVYGSNPAIDFELILSSSYLYDVSEDQSHILLAPYNSGESSLDFENIPPLVIYDHLIQDTLFASAYNAKFTSNDDIIVYMTIDSITPPMGPGGNGYISSIFSHSLSTQQSILIADSIRGLEYSISYDRNKIMYFIEDPNSAYDQIVVYDLSLNHSDTLNWNFGQGTRTSFSYFFWAKDNCLYFPNVYENGNEGDTTLVIYKLNPAENPQTPTIYQSFDGFTGGYIMAHTNHNVNKFILIAAQEDESSGFFMFDIATRELELIGYWNDPYRMPVINTLSSDSSKFILGMYGWMGLELPLYILNLETSESSFSGAYYPRDSRFYKHNIYTFEVPLDSVLSDFSITYPHNLDTLYFSQSSISDSTTFNWEESVSPNGNDIVYTFSLWYSEYSDVIVGYTRNILYENNVDTNQITIANNLIAEIYEDAYLQEDFATFGWSVRASNGINMGHDRWSHSFLGVKTGYFKAQSNGELIDAVNLWVSDNSLASPLYGHINTWDVSSVTDMQGLFENATNFNDLITSWDVSSVTNMSKMFAAAENFNQNISNWDVSNVTNMNQMFFNADSFDQDISSWNVYNVDSMEHIFNMITNNVSNENRCLIHNSWVERTNAWVYNWSIFCQLINQSNHFVPKSFKLYQNYPNPFNPITSLRYDLPNNGLVNITIYDMMGRVVKTLVNGSQTAGFKSIQWNATNDRNEPLSAGLYLYTIQAGDFRQTKKMVLLK